MADREGVDVPKPTHWIACTAQAENGSFCDAQSIPWAPFPICRKHAVQLYLYLSDSMQGSMTEALQRSMGSVVTEPEPTVQDISVVYYVLLGDVIKIGTTRQDVAARLTDLPPTRRILATEPGGPAEERARHAQFKAERLAANREWFRPSPQLWRHIEDLRAEHGDPADVSAA